MAITREMSSKIELLWNTFNTNGISNPLSAIEQISYLLLMKRFDNLELLKERQAEQLGQPVKDSFFSAEQQHLRWSQFKTITDAEEMLQIVRNEAFPFIKELGSTVANAYTRHMKDAVFIINSPVLLSKAVMQIEQMLLDDFDPLGELYEYMLSKLTTAGINGQFRTPRCIIKLIVELMNPGSKEIICDPACGTGGFLVAVAEYLQNLKDSNGELVLNDLDNRQHFNTEMFHGFDFDSTMLRISSMNLMLHGIENPQIEARHSLSQDSSDIKEAFTMILANPPFKGSVEKSSIAEDLNAIVPTTRTELLFLPLILKMLKIGGRAAVIVPEGVLSGSSKAHQAIRKTLIENHQLEAVMSLPVGIFKHGKYQQQ